MEPTTDSPAARAASNPTLARLGPLGVVAVVWVAIAVLFPTKEPNGTVQATGTPNPAGNVASQQAAAPGPIGSGSNGAVAAPAVGAQAPTTAPSAGTSSPGQQVSANGPATASQPSSTSPPATPAATAEPTGSSSIARSGVECGPGVRQIPISTYAHPCVPAWSGDNGGATYRGVTAEEIIIVERTFPESANSAAVDGVQEQAGVASDDEAQVVFETFRDYYNENYELYGRTIKWVTYESEFGNGTDEAQSKGREGACLDADVVANEIGAFAVIGTRGGGVSDPFTQCATERGLVVLNGASYFPERYFAQRHPFVWNWIMECERISHQLVEYMGKRLAFKPAKFAGDPLYQQTTRKFGVYVPNNDEYQHCTDVTGENLESKYGVEMGSRYNYTLDVSRFPDEAARGVVQFKTDGVTSLVLACDPISIIFLTQSATSQAWFPEWILLGVAGQDTDFYGQLYDQEQADGHMFGMSQLGQLEDIVGPDSEPGRLYEFITGEEIVDGTTGGYAGLTHAHNLLMAAGPFLTPEAIGAGAPTIPPGGAPKFPFGYWSMADGPDGTPGVGDHTEVEDSKEVYWTQEQVSKENGTPGTFVATYNGKRFRNGEWPAEEPPVYPEG